MRGKVFLLGVTNATLISATLALGACRNEQKTPQDNQAPQVDQAPSADGSNLPMATHKKPADKPSNLLPSGGDQRLIQCIFTSSDETRKTTSSFLKYDPTTVDLVPMELLGDYPNQALLDRINSRNKYQKLTAGVFVLPLSGGDARFPLDIDNIWYDGDSGFQHFEVYGAGAVPYWRETIGFGKRSSKLKGVDSSRGYFQGGLHITYGNKYGITASGWSYFTDMKTGSREWGSATCEEKVFGE